MAKAIKEKEMNVSAAALRNVVIDFEKYPEFVTEVVSVERLTDDTKKPRVKFELEVVKRFQYVLDFDLTHETDVHWTLVESNFFKTNTGAWLLKPLGESSTHATYELDVSFGFMVPGWVTRKLTEVNLPKMMESFENEALKR